MNHLTCFLKYII